MALALDSTALCGPPSAVRIASPNPSFVRKLHPPEQPDALLHVGPFEKRAEAPRASAPERALLEVLSEVGVRQPLQEARELVESAYSLRADVVRELLQRCTSVKTVRLCLQLGRELSSPWAAKLDPTRLPTGSDKPWVSRSAEGLLVLKR
jgi:Transcriptional regulator, AbiEi antitoxin, Type IV TA system